MPSFGLRPTQPFRLDLTSWVLRRRPDNAWDLWDGETYRRVLVVEGVPMDASVVQRGDELLVTLSGARMSSRITEQVIASLRKLLGIDVDLSAFYRFARSDSRLGPLAERFRGFKPPRFLTLFEGLVNGVSCQQLSLTVGIILLNRLVERYGREIHGRQAFPEPSDLKSADPEHLVQLGYSHNKARSLIELAQAISDGRFQPASVEQASDRDALVALSNSAASGVGPPNTRCYAVWAEQTSSRAMMSVVATTWNNGWVCANRSPMTALRAYSENGRHTEVSSTFTCCWIMCSIWDT